MQPRPTTAATATSATNDALVLRDNHDSAVTLRLNRPLQFNALSEAMLNALQRVLDDIAQDATVRCVVLGAEGRASCVGHDLCEMRGTPELAYYRALFARYSVVMQAIQALPVPVIARMHGVATAAGCQLIGNCDLVTTSDAVRFAVSGINVGLLCSTPAVALSRNVLAKRAFDMLVTGRFIDAATTVDWGLVNEAVPMADLDDAVACKVADIVSKSPTVIRYDKAMFYRQQQMLLTDAYAYAGDVMARNMMDEDAGGGIDAFLEKRPACWRAQALLGRGQAAVPGHRG